MDIKLKNKCRFRRLLVAVSVVLCAMIMICLYPYFGERAKAHEGNQYEYSGFMGTLPDLNYVIYLEGINQLKEETLTPVELYLPKLSSGITSGVTSVSENMAEGFDIQLITDDEDSNRSEYMSEQFYYQYSYWEEGYNRYRKTLDYRLVDDQTTEVLNTNVTGESEWNPDSYQLYIQIHYDGKGKPEIIEMRGYEEDGIRQTLREYLETNPMEGYYEGQMKYDSRYSFQNPTNCTFYYGMTQAQIDVLQVDWGYYGEYSYYSSGQVWIVYWALAAFIAILALIIPYLNLGFVGEKKLYRPYLEVVSVIAYILIFNPMHIGIVLANNSGIWKSALLDMRLLPVTADVLIWLGNLLWWTISFLLIYWVVSCLRLIFVWGPRRYLREQCYTYRILLYLRTLVGKMIQYMYDFVEDLERSRESNKTIFKIVIINFLVLSAITLLWTFGIMALVIYSVIIYRILVKYYKDRSKKYQLLLKATNEIAEGNLDVSIEEDLGMFNPFKVEIQKIQQGFKKAVDEEVKSQRMKTDLISNVSHDLKTPLTAIITYVDLLKDDTITQEQRHAYIDVLDKKSIRLKVLIEDIFEISKATSQNVVLNLIEIDIVNLLKQVRLELADKIEEANLDFRWNLPETKLILTLDSQKTYRIFENLLLNIIKYAMPGTRAYVDMVLEDGQVVIRMKNVSAVELTNNPGDMTERFARGDQARNTEGSGLGLAIVKSFVELQKGKLELEAEADLFKATIRWNLDKHG